MEKSRDSLAWLVQNRKGIPELRAALNAAKTSEEMFKIFAKLEARLQENQLGFDCSMMALHLLKEGKDPLKILHFGKRALTTFLKNENNPDLGIHKSSMVIGSVLNTLGYACLELKRYSESLSYLNWADRNLSKLLLDNYELDYAFKCLHDTHLHLSKLKKAMGRGDEAVIHAKKVLEIREKIAENAIDIGKANKDVADAYIHVRNFKEALPFALKALEISKKHLSDDSKEVALLRMILVSIYLELEEYDQAFEYNSLSLSSLKGMDNTCLFLKAQVQGGQTLFALGKYEEAIEALKPAVHHPENATNQRDRFLANLTIARAFIRLDKFADARKYIKMAVRILEKKGSGEGDAILAAGLMDIANLYEEMEEYEAAISVVQKALSTPELPQDLLVSCSCRLFSLVLDSGTKERSLSSLEEVVERLKENFGPEHCHVGHAYVNLGRVYMVLGRPEMAAEILVRAKDILDASLGPYHLDSLIATQTLSIAYEGMESYDLAIEIQERLVEGFKGLGLGEQDKALQTLRIKGISFKGICISSCGLKSGVSDDGKVSRDCRSKKNQCDEEIGVVYFSFSKKIQNTFC